LNVEQQFRLLTARFDVIERCWMIPSRVYDGLACEEEDHQPNEDKQRDFQPIADPRGPAVVLIPGAGERHFSSFSFV
jgi:hypothetical protein